MSRHQMPSLHRTAFLRAMVDLLREEARLLSAGVKVDVIIAGGAAVHYWAEGKVTHDIDAEFGSRFLPVPLRIPYVDEQGLV